MKPEEWDNETARLEQFFQSVELPVGPIKIGAITVNNPREFVRICLGSLRKADYNVWHSGNFTRLQMVETYLCDQMR